MSPASPALSTSYRTIVHRAWPIILANSATPLLGLADTAVIGRTGSAASLGAIALGSLIFSFVFWTFGFLRMGATGLISQADGSGDEEEVRAILARFVLMGAGIGTLLVILQAPIFKLSLTILGGSEEVEASTNLYLQIRIWGAPAALASYALMGGLIGLGKSKSLLVVQFVLNALNIILDILFAGYWGMGVAGIALGTLIAQWIAGLFALYLVIRILKQRHQNRSKFWSWSHISDTRQLTRAISVQLNIMIRTLCLLLGFGWFTQQSARLGDVTLAANHILLQFISLSAFFLDGISYATEALVGSAAGARQLDTFKVLVKRSNYLAGLMALILAVGFAVFGSTIVAAITDIEVVRATAATGLPLASIYILVSFVTFQLDGIFIGTTRTVDMRNAAMVSLAIYLVAGWFLTRYFGNPGLWLGFIIFILARAASLAILYPRLLKSITHPDGP